MFLHFWKLAKHFPRIALQKNDFSVSIKHMLFYRMLHRLDVHFAVEERRRIAATVTIARRKLHRPKKYYVSTPTTESYGTRYIYKKVWKNPVCVLLLAKFLGTFGKSFPERGTLGKKFKNPFISVQNWRRTKLTPF